MLGDLDLETNTLYFNNDIFGLLSNFMAAKDPREIIA